MGRQIEFFMHPDDEREFLDVALGHVGTALVANAALAPEPQLLADLPTSNDEVFSRNQVFLWRLGDPLSWQLVLRREGATCTKALYYLDQISSWVIEFDRSTLVDGGTGLTRGRLWIQTSFFQDGVLVRKGPILEAWYDQLARWIRRRYRRLRTSGLTVYVSPQAEMLVGSTGVLVGPEHRRART